MKSHTVISFGDIHSNIDKLKEIANFIENSANSIDSIINVGDLTGNAGDEKSYEYRAKKDSPEIPEKLQKEIRDYRLKGQEDKKKLFEINKKIEEEHFQFYKDIINDEIEKIKPVFKQISNLVGKDNFISILGNHDSVLAYNLLNNYTSFIEKESKVKLKSKSKLELIIRGTINSSMEHEIQKAIKQTFPSKDYHKLFYQYENYVPDQVKESSDTGSSDTYKFDEIENKRLQDFKSDIMVAHKLPFYAQDQTGSCSQAVKLYDNKQVAAYGGHFHSSYIIKHNNTYSFNGGTKYFIETKYVQADDDSSDKKVVDFVIFRKFSDDIAA